MGEKAKITKAWPAGPETLGPAGHVSDQGGDGTSEAKAACPRMRPHKVNVRMALPLDAPVEGLCPGGLHALFSSLALVVP